VRVLVADDHKLVGDALAEYLRNLDPEIEVLRAANLEETLACIEGSEQVDLVLLDLKMPGMDGLDGLATLRHRFPDVSVVMLSGFLDGEVVSKALSHGVSGFIPKDLSGPAMIKVLELILAGETYVPSKLVPDAGSGTGKSGQEAQASWQTDSPLGKLTAREAEVLSLLISGCSNKEIARELGIKAVTAAFHLKRVCTKLGASNRTQAATAALKLGWTAKH
jgi:DNA-binding NarL/FixJ family response regulator